ncbi:CZB domain-containing protein [Candidatus Albibeggiatoa sp. nov. BB20]|uniref:CZB domain-containing protein n=1 Tax=Candidatus Albibeggiatoa sp. nov. BB20 TaxID=3162723 RepID=UPI00336575D0
MSNLANEIYMLIVSHTKWKKRLQEMVNAGEGDFDSMLKEDSEFCEWIKSNSGQFQGDSHYEAVSNLHQEFHRETEKIIQLAADSDKETASKAMDYGSDYERLSQLLVQKIIAWHDEVSKSQ